MPEKLLRQCIESLINQSLRSIEIILVDDGSPDRCGEICDEYQKLDSRIRVLHKQNEGLCAARNSGYEMATQDWITFVDGDDWIDREMCAVMYACAVRESAQVVLGKIAKDYKKKSIPFRYPYIDKSYYGPEDCQHLQKAVLIAEGNISTAYAKLINRRFLQENALLHNEQLREGAEGIEFCVRLFLQVQRVAVVDGPCYHYIYNPGSISANLNVEGPDYLLACFEAIKQDILCAGKQNDLLEYFYIRVLYVVVAVAMNGYFHPRKEMAYPKRVALYREWLTNPLAQEAFAKATIQKVSSMRRVTLWFIRHEMFFPISLIARLRYYQRILG